MSMKWKQGDWEIHLNAIGAKAGSGWCLRHMACTRQSPRRSTAHSEDDKGQCSCNRGKCYNCNVKVPDEVKGFFELVKWKR